MTRESPYRIEPVIPRVPRPTAQGTVGAGPVAFFGRVEWKGELTQEHLDTLDSVARIGGAHAVAKLLRSWAEPPLSFRFEHVSTQDGSVNGEGHPILYAVPRTTL